MQKTMKECLSECADIGCFVRNVKFDASLGELAFDTDNGVVKFSVSDNEVVPYVGGASAQSNRVTKTITATCTQATPTVILKIDGEGTATVDLGTPAQNVFVVGQRYQFNADISLFGGDSTVSIKPIA